MELILIAISLFTSLVSAVLIIRLVMKKNDSGSLSMMAKLDFLDKNVSRIEYAVKEEVKESRDELNSGTKSNREELNNNLVSFQTTLLEALNGISKTQLEQLRSVTEANQKVLGDLNRTIEEKITLLISKSEENNKASREELRSSLKDFNELQRQKFTELIAATDQNLEKMRVTVDEKLQKTLEARLGQSFELVRSQLESVQKGLGEMQSLAQDVGGLKKVLTNVKTRGTFGEVQLAAILEQILAPEQYEANVRTKKGSAETVEFAIKLPGKDDQDNFVYLPVDAKFPQEAYHALQDAYEKGDVAAVENASKLIDAGIRKFAKDIRDKYIDPPHTTDFGIMFLPVEGLYAEVIRRTSLMEQLQREYKIVITGPTTLAAILNSLQMGFKTLAIQKRSSEVWQILSAIKTEFQKFGGVLEKAQKKINEASNEIDDLVGTRTRAIEKKLRQVQEMPAVEAQQMIMDTDPGLGTEDVDG